MRILVVHNRYTSRGGEDVVLEAETALLREHGHDVFTWEEDNKRLEVQSRLSAAANAVWSISSQKQLQDLIKQYRPELVHFHNTFLRISPAAYYTCQKAGIPVVQTLHNYRLICPEGNLFREGKICEDCLGKWGLLPSMHHRCWHNSHVQTAVVATMLSTHRLLGTWQQQVDAYIVLTEFGRQKFSEAGLPAEKIWVKPNFVVASTQPATSKISEKSFALFVGRLSSEKGVDLLVKTWKTLPDVPLRIVGDGPLRAGLEQAVQISGKNQVEFCGSLPRSEVFDLMEKANFLVVPSNCYEGLPTAIVEAFSRNLPVLATNHGAMAEIVRHGETGIHFEAYDAADLAYWVRYAWEHHAELSAMAKRAFQEYQNRYLPSSNYEMLMNIYQNALARHGSRG